MARLVLSVAGAVIGAYVGGPEGAQIGWTIGSMVGGAIDPEQIKGPKINDLRVQTSTYGIMIPMVHGSFRVAGNVIFSTDKREYSTTESGKGGPESTTYHYYVNIAIMLHDAEKVGPIVGIKKIWANGRLICNIGDDATDETRALSGATFSDLMVYTGTYDQLPDAMMEAELGVGNVPAYRGRAYVALSQFQLGDFGNEVPNFEFEVVQSGAAASTAEEIYRMYDFSFQNVEYVNAIAPGLTYPSWQDAWQHGAAENNALGGLSDTVPVWITLPDIAVRSASLGIGYGTSITPNLTPAQTSAGYILATDPGGLYTGSNTTMSAAPFAAYGAHRGAVALGLTIPANTCSATGDPCAEEALTIYPGNAAYCINCAGDITRNYHYVPVAGSFKALRDRKRSPFQDGVGPVIRSTDPRYINAEFWTAEYDAAVLAGTMPEGLVYEVDYPQTLTCPVAQATWDGESITSSAVTLASIVSAHCENSGLAAEQINVDGLTDLVAGFAITRQGPARAIIEQLQRGYHFDAVESDLVVKFPKRGAAPVVTIPYDDLAAHMAGEDAPDPIAIQRLQEVDLPQRVTVNYANVDSGYQQGSESCQRINTASDQQVVIELAIAMTPDEAAKIAEIALYEAYLARNTIPLALTKQYARVEPTDVLDVAGPQTTYRLRVVKKHESGPLLKFDTVTEDAVIYTSTATGGTSQPTQEQLTNAGITYAEFLDIPILRDSDNDAGFYVALGAQRDAWTGATLFKSSDGLTYSEVDSVVNTAVRGQCQTVLGDWQGVNAFDECNTLDVTLVSGTLSSHTRNEVLDGANAALVGSEIIQFKTATLIGTDQYRLSGLLRGRRGTEQHIGTHQAGERFVLLTLAGTLRPAVPASEIGMERYYKPVSFTKSLASTTAQAFTNSAVGLMPYAPARLRGGKQANGDFLIQWTRRDRLDGHWRNSVDVPMSEATESYSIDIMNGSTVVRTLTSSTPSVVYTDAMANTDFGSSQSTLTVRVYQVSAVVGRGFAATHTY